MAQMGQDAAGEIEDPNWLKTQQRERSVLLGREIFDRDLHRYQLDLCDAAKARAKIDWLTKELGHEG